MNSNLRIHITCRRLIENLYTTVWPFNWIKRMQNLNLQNNSVAVKWSRLHICKKKKNDVLILLNYGFLLNTPQNVMSFYDHDGMMPFLYKVYLKQSWRRDQRVSLATVFPSTYFYAQFGISHKKCAGWKRQLQINSKNVHKCAHLSRIIFYPIKKHAHKRWKHICRINHQKRHVTLRWDGTTGPTSRPISCTASEMPEQSGSV